MQGNPTVVVRNMPGGDATIGANYVWGARPDGLTLLATAGSVYLGDLFAKPAGKYSLREMTAIVALPVPSLVYMRAGLFDRPEDIVKARGIIFGYTISGLPSIYFVLAKEFVGIPTEKVVLAYPGTGDARRAFLAGEINASSENVATYNESLRPYVDKGEIKVLYQAGSFDEKGAIVRHRVLPPDIMTVGELYEKIYGKPASGIEWEAYRALLASTDSIDKALFLPPKTPESIQKAYWTAAEAMTRDPAFRKEAEAMVGPGGGSVVGENFDKLVKREFGLKPDIRDWLKTFLSTRYGIVV